MDYFVGRCLFVRLNILMFVNWLLDFNIVIFEVGLGYNWIGSMVFLLRLVVVVLIVKVL